jgi:hypothetical protein
VAGGGVTDGLTVALGLALAGAADAVTDGAGVAPFLPSVPESSP